MLSLGVCVIVYAVVGAVVSEACADLRQDLVDHLEAERAYKAADFVMDWLPWLDALVWPASLYNMICDRCGQ